MLRDDAHVAHPHRQVELFKVLERQLLNKRKSCRRVRIHHHDQLVLLRLHNSHIAQLDEHCEESLEVASEVHGFAQVSEVLHVHLVNVLHEVVEVGSELEADYLGVLLTTILRIESQRLTLVILTAYHHRAVFFQLGSGEL